MKRLDSNIRNHFSALLSVVVAAVIALGSVVQYHHHCHGDIFLSLSTSVEIGFGAHHGIESCNHSHHGQSESQSQCAMHLDDTTLSCDDLRLCIPLAVIGVSSIALECPVLNLPPPVYGNFGYFITPVPLRDSNSLRAPPAIA